MKEFTASGFFFLRTPLLPFQDFLGLSQGSTFLQALRNGGDLAAASDRGLTRLRLRDLADLSEVKEALWLASPAFLESLNTWRKEPESENGQKLEQALYRYIARITSRPTPFGLFAGCAVGQIGAETRLEIGRRDTYWRRSRLDMEYLCTLADKISSDPLLQNQIAFRPNTSLFLAGDRYHHVQGYFSDSVRMYRTVATEPTPYLAATLARASGVLTPQALAAGLVHDDPGIAMEEAEAYIRQLVESQVLVSDLVPPVTGPEPIDDLLSHLPGTESSPLRTALCSVSARLRRLDEGGLGNDPGAYQEIVNTVSQLPAEFKLEHLVQVDMMKPAANASLDRRLVQDILRGVEALHSIHSSSQRDPFRQFKEDFRERYQEQEIPLVLALDEDVGIGFERKDGPDAIPEPLIENIDVPDFQEEAEVRVTQQELVLLRKLEELAKDKKTTLELDSELLETLRAENPLPLPDAFSVLGQLAGPPPGRVERKSSFYLQNADGPSGALLLARFCHADGALTTLVKDHVRAEEETRAGDNVVFAEIAHLPEGRTGNILFRPILREYEIPFLASSRVPPDRQIPITDLMLSLQDDRVVLRSQRLGCEVIPRLTSAHNYTGNRSLNIYKFLCLLQMQGVCGAIAWDWGILDEAAFLPRVTLGNIVLAVAQWRVTREVIAKLSKEESPERLRNVDQWRTNQGIPRFALLAESDNQLLIDFENVLSVESFIEYIKKRDSARLLEMFPGPDRLCAHGPEGSFTNEVVIPFVRSRPSAQKVADRTQLHTSSAAVVRNAERNFLPGSEWLYAKIYASPSRVDRLLVEHIKPLVERVLASGEADGWFFVRYGYPQWHLRLRLHGDPGTLAAKVLPQLWQCVDGQTQQGGTWRVQLDTYERELERYGGPAGMGIAERLFQLDSELAVELLASISDSLGAKTRWHMAFVSVDRLLAGLGFDLRTKHRLANSMGKINEQNSAAIQRYKTQLSEKFRQERQTLEMLLENSREDLQFPPAVRLAWAQFSERIKSIRSELEQKQQAGKISKAILELSGSYVHMHLNRMFRSAPDAQEMVLCDFLARTYGSLLARE